MVYSQIFRVLKSSMWESGHINLFCLMVCLDNKKPSSEPHSLLCVISSPLAWEISDFSKYKCKSPSFVLSIYHPNPVPYTDISRFSIKKCVTELTCFMSWWWCQKSQLISGSQTEIRGDCFLFSFPQYSEFSCFCYVLLKAWPEFHT